jgi:PAS domain S-box-containing protein
MNDPGDHTHLTGLRQRAERQLSRLIQQSVPNLSPENVMALAHELQVNQIELEMQCHELRRTQAELEESRTSYQELYESMPVGYVTLDRDGRMYDINPTGMSLLKWNPGSRPVQHFNPFISDKDSDRFTLFCRGIVTKQTADAGEFEMKCSDGSSFPAALQAAPVKTGEGKGDRLRLVFKDISKRKEAENTLRQQQLELEAGRVALQDLTAKLLTAQEEECKRIARELHDDHCQRVTALILDANLMLKQCQQQAPALTPKMASMSKKLTDLLGELRSLSHELVPRNLGDVSLIGPMRELIGEFHEKADFQVTFSERNVPEKIPPAVMTTLFRLLQESLSNITKHAKAKHVCVTLIGIEQGIALTVQDDGIGFDPALVSGKRKSVGILGMKERLRLLGGTMMIDSRPNEGTTLTFTIPLPEVN